MATFGDASQVGRNMSPPGINPQVAAQATSIAPPPLPGRPVAQGPNQQQPGAGRAVLGAGLAAGGAAATYRAIRPNLEGRRKKAQARVTSLDERIRNAQKYNKPNMNEIATLRRQRDRAAKDVSVTARTLATKHGRKHRVGRAALGAAAFGGAAAALKPFMPKKYGSSGAQPAQPPQPKRNPGVIRKDAGPNTRGRRWRTQVSDFFLPAGRPRPELKARSRVDWTGRYAKKKDTTGLSVRERRMAERNDWSEMIARAKRAGVMGSTDSGR